MSIFALEQTPQQICLNKKKTLYMLTSAERPNLIGYPFPVFLNEGEEHTLLIASLAETWLKRTSRHDKRQQDKRMKTEGFVIFFNFACDFNFVCNR